MQDLIKFTQAANRILRLNGGQMSFKRLIKMIYMIIQKGLAITEYEIYYQDSSYWSEHIEEIWPNNAAIKKESDYTFLTIYERNLIDVYYEVFKNSSDDDIEEHLISGYPNILHPDVYARNLINIFSTKYKELAKSL